MSYTYKCAECGVELKSQVWLDKPIVVMCHQCLASPGQIPTGVSYYGIQVERRQGIHEQASNAEPRSASQRLKVFEEANHNAG